METKWTCKLIGAKLFSIIFDQVHTCQLPFAVFIGAYDWCRSAGMLLLIIQCAKRRYKNSVRTLEDLHQKDLFPYNPKPLLKSLARFEESSAETIILCLVTPAISVVQLFDKGNLRRQYADNYDTVRSCAAPKVGCC